MWRRHQSNGSQPVLLRHRSSTWFILLTVSIAVFTDLFLYGVIVPVIPFALTVRVGVPPENVQHWVSVLLAVYGASLLVTPPIFGWFADRSKSRRTPLLLGLIALAGSTTILCVGNTIALLIVGRLLQGASAGVVWTVGLALLVDTVGQNGIGQAMGYVMIAMSLGILVAPLLGGVVYDAGGYYPVFAMCFAIIGLDIILRLLLIEKKVAVKWSVVDEGLSSGVSTHGQASGGHSAKDSEKEIAAQSGTETFTDPPVGNRPQTKKSVKFPPVVTLLKSPRLLAALWGCFVQALLIGSFDSVLPLFVNRVFGWTSTGAGLIFLAMVIPSFSSPLVGYLTDKYGGRWLATSGFLFALPPFVLLRLVTENSIGQKVLLCALLALIGVNLTLVMPPLMAEVTLVVSEKERKKPGIFGKGGAYAQAYALFNMAYAAGALIGPLWGGFVVLKAGWGTMAWSLGLLSGLSAIPAVIYTGGIITQRREQRERRAEQRAATQSGNGTGASASQEA